MVSWLVYFPTQNVCKLSSSNGPNSGGKSASIAAFTSPSCTNSSSSIFLVNGGSTAEKSSTSSDFSLSLVTGEPGVGRAITASSASASNSGSFRFRFAGLTFDSVLIRVRFEVTGAVFGVIFAAASLRVCHTLCEDNDERHLNFFLQSGRGHSKGCSPVCNRKCAFRLYFLLKYLPHEGYGHLCVSFVSSDAVAVAFFGIIGGVEFETAMLSLGLVTGKVVVGLVVAVVAVVVTSIMR